jgi:hypothetical protein
MWSHRIASLLVFGLMISAAFAAPGPTAVRVFNIQHVAVADAAAAVQLLLSVDGSLTVQPHHSRITVQDRPEVVARVAEVIAELDVAPIRYQIEVELLEGTGDDLPEHERTDVDSRLRRMFPFAAYRRIGTTSFDGRTGEQASADLGEGYRVSFLANSLGVSENTPWGIPDPGTRVHLQWLTLQRVVVNPAGEQRAKEVARASVYLSVKQEVFIGAGASEDSSGGLVLILQAHSIGEK